MYDIIIKNSKILDGTGIPCFRGNIGLKGEQIVEVSKKQLSQDAKRTIDGESLFSAPGFVDMHTHADISLFTNPLGKSLVMQGVTLVLTGNCGSSPAPLNDDLKKGWLLRGLGYSPGWDDFPGYLDAIDREKFCSNVATQIGHNSIRAYVMGEFADRPSNNTELNDMSLILESAMEAGAIGFSTGLMYRPGIWSETEEIIELCKIVEKSGGVYTSHMRGEANEVLQSVSEVVKIAEKSNVSAHIGHHRAECRVNWGLIKYTLDMLRDANLRGYNITCDFFPYEACGVGGGIPLPRWANPLYMPKEDAIRIIKNPKTRKQIIKEIRLGTELGPEKRSYEPIDSTDDVVITIFPDEPELQGKTVTEIAQIKGYEEPLDFFLDTVTSEKPFGVVAFDVWEEDLKKLVKSPLAMIGTDSGFVDDINAPNRHPRAYGSYAKILGEYTRERKLISWEEAIMKLSTRPYSKLGIKDRGIIRPGFYADLVLFNPNTVDTKADYSGLAKYPKGINYVIINGEIVVEQSQHTGKKPGKLIRKQD
jgi:N-acyl-D-amino-acid deacylase